MVLLIRARSRAGLSAACTVLLVLFVLPVASACGPDKPEEEWGCPEYTHSVGDEKAGAAFNERGQAAVYLGAMYVFWDSTPGLTNDGYLFSLWFLFEANGQDGPQRADEYCQQVPRDESDTYLC